MKLIDKYGDHFSGVGFGGLMGFTSGYAAKKIGKVAAFVLGASFLVVQGLTYTGRIKGLKWSSVEKEATKALDLNKDGKLDKEDIKALWRKTKGALTKNLPSSGGFASGFALGFYSG